MREDTFIRDLGDGLVLRRARREDAEAVAKLNSEVFCNRETREPSEFMAAWTMDMLTRPHPTITPDDYTVVERTEDGALVSSMVLISQTWSYDGVPFGVGQPEVVVTRPEYRRKGLVRAQFEVAHRRSTEKGEMVQAITGIPFFYRQFGYEMTMDLGGSRSGAAADVPKLKEGQEERFAFRPATETDVPFLAEVYANAQRRSLVSCVRNEAIWRLDLLGRSDKGMRPEVRIIESTAGDPVGYITHNSRVRRGNLELWGLELRPGVSWLAVMPAVLRYIKRTGEMIAAVDEKETFHSYTLSLGRDHPAYQAVRASLPAEGSPYAWYLRVSDLPRFLLHIGPVLERRLAESIAVGHTGELKLSFYRGGLRMVFAEGKLEAVEPWQPMPEDEGNAGFSGLTFLHLVFGHHTTEELRQVYPDTSPWGDEANVLLKALFPKKASLVWPLA
ncbi:MAG: GNAT family N-acetyltransferase [Anaerolineae bacterium]|nr:GNAT family N-acetyltransferase [Anaerolineae bacterium]